MSQTNRKPQYIAVGIILFVIVWSAFLWFYDATALVDVIGAENGYLVMALISLFGGVSSIGGVSYVATLLTLSAGGLDPLYLAIASGLGISVGDTVYFYLGKKGLRTFVVEEGEEQGTVRRKVTRWIKTLTDWIDAKPDYFAPVITYLIAAFTPTPNDLLTIALGMTNRRYLPTIIALVLANMTHTYLIARFGEVIPFF